MNAVTYRTKYETTASLSDGSGQAGTMIEVPAGTRCEPRGDGAFWVLDWRSWGGDRFKAGSTADWDATHRGIVVQGLHVGEYK